MPLEINVAPRGADAMVIHLEGTLDARTSADLEKQVDAALVSAPPTLIFDLAHLKFISSAGLRVFAKARKVQKARGAIVLLVHLQPQIQEVFEIVKALPGEAIFTSVQEMDEYLLARQHAKLQEAGP